MKRNKMAMLLALAAGTASAGSWNAAQWQTLFQQVPAPPASLAQAGKLIAPQRDDSGNLRLTLSDAALLKSHQDAQAGMKAMSEQALHSANAVTQSAGIDLARMQTDQAYAQQMRQKMASMSQAEQMQMAMQMSQGFSAAQNRDPAVMRAGIELQSYVTQEARAPIDAIDQHYNQQLGSIISRYDAQHAALDAQLSAGLKACPLTYRCGEAGCDPDPKCVAALDARVPGVIDSHRRYAAAELNEERALFEQTRSGLLPIIAKATTLAQSAEAAKVDASMLNTAYNLMQSEAVRLQSLSARAILRAGFWQNIQPQRIADSYYQGGPLAYHYQLDADTRLDAPGDLPKGW